jgi:type IV pilus assembly protein PilM
MASPRFAWGIDVGNRALKAIKLVRDGEVLRIDDFEVIEHEQILSQAGDNRESLLQSALANFAQKHSAKGGTVAIGVSGQASFARFIKLPPVDPSKISEIVKFEAVQQIPFPLEEVEWSYQLFQSPDSPEVEVGIFAMKRELVNQTIQNFTDVGLEVTTVQMNPLADYNGLYHDDRIEGTTMVVDVGAENTDLIIAEGENIWMRSIPIGGNNFTEALVKSFQLKFPKAEELKRNAATSKYGRQILQAMKPVFSDLVGEIQRSIGFYSSTHRESRIGKVLALGGTFRLPGLQKYLQQNLSLEVARIDRLNAPSPADAKFVAAFNENILSSMAAYGLALQAMGQGKITSSLLPEKIRRERMWKEKTPWFAAAALLVVAATAIPVGKLYADKIAYQNQENIRTQITSELAKGRKLDANWKNDVENSGSEARTEITNYLTVLPDRDLALNLTMEIGRAIPLADPKEDAKPRGMRNIVELAGYTMRYEPDITSIVSLPDDQFNELVDKIELPGMTNQGGLGQGMRSLNPRLMGGGGQIHHQQQAPTPPPNAGPTTAQRGFIVTILCRTPLQKNPAQLVTSTVAQALRQRNQTAADPPKGFIIKRVTIPSEKKFSVLYPSGTLIEKPQQTQQLNPPGEANNGAGAIYQPTPTTNGRPPYPGLNNPGYVPPLRGQSPLAGTGINGLLPPEKYPDPMHKGESVRDDTLVTVLVAVEIDPPPLAPAPGTPGAPANPNAPKH